MKEKQTSAECMFEMLGYELDTLTKFYPEEYKHICYINGKDVILFTVGKTISVKKYFNDMLNEKDCNDYACNITYEELKAINKQIEELGR